MYAENGNLVLENMNKDDFDLLIVLGDLAYDLHDDWGNKGDNFFAILSQISSRIPTIIIGGNHDLYDYTNFLNFRFRSPGCDVSEDNNFFHIYLMDSIFVFFNHDHYR